MLEAEKYCYLLGSVGNWESVTSLTPLELCCLLGLVCLICLDGKLFEARTVFYHVFIGHLVQQDSEPGWGVYNTSEMVAQPISKVT